MNVLGIETSCDETSAAVVKNGKHILSNIIASSLKEHSKYGGIIPEIASRRQLESINPVVEQTLDKAKLKLKDIGAVAVTSSPGLIGSLLVGSSFAKAIAFSMKKPLIEVDHIKAHLYSNFLHKKEKNIKNICLPAIGLVVSGGHTTLYYVKDFNTFKVLGHTIDDAAGEAFDKVAKILDIGYPGGPAIDRLAQKATKKDIHFTCAKLPDTFNFSFSGIKTGVLYYYRDNSKNKNFNKAEVAYGFQDSLISIIVQKSIAACKKMKSKSIIIGGGVAANTHLRNRIIKEAENNSIKTYFPDIILCTDNAAMIAGLGYHILKKRS